MPNFPYPAGEGNTGIYPISGSGDSAIPFKKDEHYLEISASSMFVNKKGNWFKKKSVTGLISIKIGNQPPIQVTLKSFELDNGQKKAPFSNKELLPIAKYKGGGINVVAHLNGIKQDTGLSTLLGSAAVASLEIVKGMAIAPTSQALAPLQAAGDSLINGVKTIISNGGDKDFTIFDPKSGLDHTIQPTNLRGDEFYVLLHRGSELEEDKVSISKLGDVEYAFYNGQLLEDGAWILLQINRVNSFRYDRPWKSNLEKLKNELENLISDVFETGLVNIEEAKKQFSPTEEETQTISDQFIAVREAINNDEAIIWGEQRDLITAIKGIYVHAKQAIGNNNKSIYFDFMELLTKGKSKEVSNQFSKAIGEVATSISNSKNAVVGGNKNTVSEVNTKEVIESMFNRQSVIKMLIPEN